MIWAIMFLINILPIAIINTSITRAFFTNRII